MTYTIDEEAWHEEMREASRQAIVMAATQMGDPAAADEWRETGFHLCLESPAEVAMEIYYSRPESSGEPPRAGTTALVLDYLPYLKPRSSPHIFDPHVRKAVLQQIRGRSRDAEIAKLDPGSINAPWATTIDILSWIALSHFLSQDSISELVMDIPQDVGDADALPHEMISRNWQSPDAKAAGLIQVHLIPTIGRVKTDGLEFRLEEGSPLIRIENDASRQEIHIELEGINLPANAIFSVIDHPLSKIIDDPALFPAADMLRVKRITNHNRKDRAILGLVCDEILIRCAPAPEGATFSWETLRDPMGDYPKQTRIIAHDALK